MLSVPSVASLTDLAKREILNRVISGRSDVQVSKLIERLGTADWVRQGRRHHEATNHEQCPFCQQPTRLELKDQLDAFFDSSYEEDVAALRKLQEEYRSAVVQLASACRDIKEQRSPFVDIDVLDGKMQSLGQLAKENLRKIAAKVHEPTTLVQLDSLDEALQHVTALIQASNAKAREHNAVLDNRSQEQIKLGQDVWRYVVETLGPSLDVFDRTKRAADAAIKSLDEKIRLAEKTRGEVKSQIADLERQITSAKPTVERINRLLRHFEFDSFSLAEADTAGLYQIVRSDGTDASRTLSEGERTFITFLYFIHLLDGSTDPSGASAERVVVFDDPISSLDSDILHVVSTLIRRIIENTRAGRGTVRQVFVLTHNVYFHKEVSFEGSGNNVRADVSFWTVHKNAAVSTIRGHASNPVTTSYALLWQEVARPDCSVLTIQNSMRRILESYFKILGGISYDAITKGFEGRDQVVCQSLVRWIQDGSHNAMDDLHVSRDGVTVDRYKAVFKKIFEKLGHVAHYRMMMKEPDPSALADSSAQPQPPAVAAVDASLA